jgi:hypothetical protein
MPDKTRRDSVQPLNSDIVGQLLADSLAHDQSQVAKRPWAIKGVDEATIQLCKLAARGKGMKINRWVADALCKVAQQQLGHSPSEAVPGDLSQLFERICRLEGEVSALSKSHAAIVSAVVSR